MIIFLETERLRLRRFTQADIDNLHALDSDPDVMRFINGGQPPDLEVIRNRTLPYFLSYYDRYEGYGFWAAIEKTSGDFVGWFHFRPSGDEPDEIELGYRLKKSTWGKGYATEGSAALIEKGFRELGTRRVAAKALVANSASIRVMEKVGLKPDSLFIEDRFPGTDKRAVKYSLDASDYKPDSRD